MRQIRDVTYARLQLKNSLAVDQPFKVEYTLKVPDALKNRVNRAYHKFVDDCLNDLEPIKKQPLGDYVGKISKNKRDGQGGLRMSNGDVYKGGFKNDKRHGTGICQFASGAIYKGDWREDQPMGQGILYSGKNEIIEGRFENGAAPHGRVKIMFQDGSYFDGSYSNHRRRGQGLMIYPNGEWYEGEWDDDKRVGRGKMHFSNKSVYKGQFIDD